MSLKLLFVSARFLPCLGGTELHTYEVSHRFAQQGYDVTVLTTDVSGKLPPTEEMDGIRVIREKPWFRHTDLYFSPKIFRRIFSGEWDVVHIQGYHTFVSPVSMLAAALSKKPYLLSFHSGGHSSAIRRALRPVQIFMLRPLLKRAEYLIGSTQWEIDSFSKILRLPQEKFKVVSNGSQLPGQDQPESVVTSENSILSIGRLEKYKGHQRIISALPQILQTIPNTRLTIVGNGPYKSQLQKLAKSLKVEEHVEFVYFAMDERDKMRQLIADADLTAILSDYESQSITALECLSMNKRLLVVESSALLELVDYGLVKSIPIGASPATLAGAALNHLLEPPLESDRITMPTWENAHIKTGQLYKNILGEQRFFAPFVVPSSTN